MKPPVFKTILITIGSFMVVGSALLVWLMITRLPDETLLSGDTVTVAATIFPLADITKHIGGDHVRVVQILPPGASEHDYMITPRQLADLQQARVLFAIGQGLDEWATAGTAEAVEVPVVVVDRGVSLREFGEAEDDNGHGHDESSIDPHYWLAVPHAQAIARTIASSLKEVDPEQSDLYEANLDKYVRELSALERELQTLAAEAEPKEFIAVHDAWSYFADQYGLELVATYEPVEGREPSIGDIQELQAVVRKYGIEVFFTEPQKQSTGATRFLQDDLGLEIRVLDPIGGVGGRDSYIEMMRSNMRAIVQ